MDPATIDAFSQAVQGLAAKAGAAAVQYGPQAMDIATQYVHATALLNLTEDIVVFLIALLGVGLYIALWVGSRKLNEGFQGKGDMWAIRVFGSVPALGLIIPCTMSSLQDFFSPETFFGLFYPKMAILHYAISLTH